MGSTKAMPRRKAHKSYTPEQRAAAKERDAALAAAADQAMTDPELGARVAALLGGGSRLLSYSIRNQALLMKQAAERGMPLNEVDTFKGWQSRGRQVRKGERGLQIVRPRGRDAAKEEGDAEAVEAIVLPADGTAEEEGGRPRFRVMTVFEISQTDGPEETGAITHEDGATRLFQNLTEQAERHGYNVSVWPGPVAVTDAVKVDHDAASIVVSEDADPAEMLSKLAQEVAAIAVIKATAGTTRRARTAAATPADGIPTITVL